MGIWTPFPIMMARRPAPAFMAIAMTVVTASIAVIAAIPTDAVSTDATKVAAMAAAVIVAAAIAEVVIAVPKAGPAEMRLSCLRGEALHPRQNHAAQLRRHSSRNGVRRSSGLPA